MADDLGDLPDRDPFVAHRVEHRPGRILLDGQPVERRRVLHVDGGPSGGPVAEAAGGALGAGPGDQLRHEAVVLARAVHRAGEHDQGGADAGGGGREGVAQVGDAGGDGAFGDQLVALGRRPAGGISVSRGMFPAIRLPTVEGC